MSKNEVTFKGPASDFQIGDRYVGPNNQTIKSLEKWVRACQQAGCKFVAPIDKFYALGDDDMIDVSFDHCVALLSDDISSNFADVDLQRAAYWARQVVTPGNRGWTPAEIVDRLEQCRTKLEEARS